jgi:hypothetical protein
MSFFASYTVLTTTISFPLLSLGARMEGNFNGFSVFTLSQDKWSGSVFKLKEIKTERRLTTLAWKKQNEWIHVLGGLYGVKNSVICVNWERKLRY